MNTLNNYIKQNRRKFDDELPPKGHEQRFAEKLGLKNEKKIRLTTIFIFKTAAIAVLVLLSSLYIKTRFVKPEPEIYTLAQVDPKYADVEFYYTKTTNNLMLTIDNIIDNEPQINRETLINELQLLDSLHIRLQNELKANPYDETVINSMIEYYDFKVNVLNQIIEQLKNIKPSKTKNHETYSL